MRKIFRGAVVSQILALNSGCADLPTTEAWRCGDDQVRAFPLAEMDAAPRRVRAVGDWWLLSLGDAVHAVSRCGETTTRVVEDPVEDTFITNTLVSNILPLSDTAALACSQGGLERIELGEAASASRVVDLAQCVLAGADEAGGGFVLGVSQAPGGDPRCAALPEFLNEGHDPAGSLRHVAGPDGSGKVTTLHPCTRAPVRLGDGWYTRARGGAWLRLDLDAGTTDEVHPLTAFVVPNRSGDAWLWSPGGDDEAGAPLFARPLGGEDVDLGLIRPGGQVIWNGTGTHVLLNRVDSIEATWTRDVVDVATGARIDLAAEYPDMSPCGALAGGFALCDDDDALHYFDPATKTATLLLEGPRGPIDEEAGAVRYVEDGDLWEIDTAGARRLVAAHVDRYSYFALPDGRHVTLRSDPGYPFDDGFAEVIDCGHLVVVDPTDDSETELVPLCLGEDIYTISPELGAIAYTRSGAQAGLWLYPLPP